jgi:hypothetical protein
MTCLSVQAQKKEINFYNEIYQKIDKEEFLKYQNSLEYYDLYFENDSTFTALLVRKKNLGKLNEKEFHQLKKNLNLEENYKKDLIVIIYYPGKDSCNRKESRSGWNIFDRDYLKNLNKIASYSNHWIYKNNEDLKYYYPKKVNWRKDNNQFIEKTFFKYHFPCFSFVVIDNEGNYISSFGEFGKQKVWDFSSELVNKKT